MLFRSGADGSARAAGRFRTWYTSQPSTSAISAGSAVQHVAPGRVRRDPTPTPASCAMPVLPQRWLGFRQAEGAPRRPISLHCYGNFRQRSAPPYSSSVSLTRSEITAGSSSKAQTSVRSNPCGPVMRTLNPPRNGSAASATNGPQRKSRRSGSW